MKMRLIVTLSCLLLAAAAPAASSKDAHYTQSTAVVVRAHPWLTRGLPRESLIGIRFWGGIGGQYGGPLTQPVTFRFQLKNCTREDLGELALWYQPYTPVSYGWREGLDRMAGTTAESTPVESTASETEFTLTYTPRPDNGDTWIHPRTETRAESGYIWLTAAIDPAISRDAEIRVSVDNKTIRLRDGTYAVDNNLLADGSVAPHRVYPYKYRVNAYLRDDRMAKAAGRARDVFSGDGTPEGEAQEARLRVSNLTELTLIDVFPIYNAKTDTFELSWDRKREGGYRVNDTLGLERLKGFRDDYHPEARVHISLTKDGWPYGSDARVNEHTLDSMNTGTAFRASVLGHAVGDKYRLAFVNTLVALMEKQEIDGLDVDWEYPNTIRNVGIVENDEFRKYGLFLRDLAEAFFNHGWELAMCTNLGYQMPTGNDTALFAVPDFINSMAYGGSPLNASNQVMSTAVNLLTSRGVPKRRIVVGQAIYSDTSYHLGWDEIANYLRRDGSKGYFSRLDSDTYWINWSYNGNTGSYHTYTGPTTYRAKCNRIRIEGYGGAMSWGYYSDTRWGTDDLLCLAQNQAQAIWPHDYFWPTPPKSEDDFYLLDSEEDWFWFRDNPGHNVRLAGDIIFTHDPLPISSFSGTLDGAGYTLTLPKDVWLCTFDNTALFQSITGTVKDLTVVLEGRVVCRADRKNDSSVYTSSVAGDGRAAVLAAALIDPGKLENVTVRVAAGAEVQGAKQAAAVVGDVWHGSNSDWIAMKGVRVEIDGIVRNLADNSGGTTFNPNGVCAGGLLAKLGEGDGVTGVRLEDCSVSVGAQGRVANETGSGAVAAAGAIGHLATTGPTIQNLTVSLASADSVTSVAGNAPTGNSAQPWLNAYYAITVTGEDLSGAVSVPRGQEEAFRAKWDPYWLEDRAPLRFPGYRLRLR